MINFLQNICAYFSKEKKNWRVKIAEKIGIYIIKNLPSRINANDFMIIMISAFSSLICVYLTSKEYKNKNEFEDKLNHLLDGVREFSLRKYNLFIEEGENE